MIRSIRQATAAALLALTACLGLVCPSKAAPADVPPWPASSVIYTIYPSIFSPKGDFAGITAQLGRLKALGVTDVWLMPVTPIGKAVNGHPSFGSPYAVHDYYGVNPDYGTPTDLHALIAKAHKLGLRVILDQVLNHTSWDNALVTAHPEYYVHSDADSKNPATIKMAFNYGDVAQLNYANSNLRTYMIGMLRFWLKTYDVDGFRFDTASHPDGPSRLIPADFWQQLGIQLRRTKPNVLLLGECEDPQLPRTAFALDYGWWMRDTIKAVTEGQPATIVEGTWHHQSDDFPPGTQHLSVADDWDYPRDVNTYGGPTGALGVEAFYLTETGVPLIYNGMEIGNSAGAVNPHTPIDWSNINPAFPKFYHQMLALRHANPAFTQGTMTWLANSVPAQVLTYLRTGGGKQFLVEVNLSASPATGTIIVPTGPRWTPVSIEGVQTAGSPDAPPKITLPPKGFAIFQRPAEMK